MKRTFIFVGVLFALALAGWGLPGLEDIPTTAAQGATPMPTAFPTGAFEAKPINGVFASLSYNAPVVFRKVFSFNADGSYVIHGHSLFVGMGKVTVTANQISIVSQAGYAGCPADQAGTYKWAFDGTTLNFTDAQDACESRKADLTNGLTKRADAPAAPVALEKIRNLGTTKTLTILPLVETVTSRETLTTTFGVAYLIKTDNATILFDLGNNPETRDPSPLLFNMQQLGIKVSDVNVIAISHAHFDHTGGAQWQFNNTFSLGNRQVDLSGKRIYVPQPLTYPGSAPIVTTQPMTISQSVATIGNLPMTAPGYGDEQILAINVEGKGIVLITGCGHPTTQKIVERAKALFDEPIYGIAGGLHITSKDPKVFQPSVDYLKGLKLGLVALSPHDSSPEAIQAIREIYPSAFQDIKVGQAITVGQ